MAEEELEAPVAPPPFTVMATATAIPVAAQVGAAEFQGAVVPAEVPTNGAVAPAAPEELAQVQPIVVPVQLASGARYEIVIRLQIDTSN